MVLECFVWGTKRFIGQFMQTINVYVQSVFTQNIPLSKLDHKTDCKKAFKRRKLLLSPITGSIKN